MEFLEEYKEFDKKLHEIAKIYADVIQNTKYSNIMSVKYSPSSNSTHFYFSYQPSPSGIGGNASLPISLVDEEGRDEKVKNLALLRLQELKEDKEKNTCKTCGNVKSNFYNHYTGFCNYDGFI